MFSPDITQVEIDAVNEVLRTGQLSIGSKIEEFEGGFAEYVGTRYAIGVNSGSSALHLTIVAAGIGPGDEVITPSFSFVASANCVLYERATPVFVDIDPLTGNLAPDLIEYAITPHTKAIIVVHAFGQPADMDAIRAIADEHNLLVFEDACQAVGAEYKRQRVGTFSKAATFAFYPTIQMTTGEGGLIVTDDEAWSNLFRSLRNQGRDIFESRSNHTRLGYNYRLDEMSAALGVAQMSRIEELLAKRAQIANWYNERIEEISGLEKLHIAESTTTMSWFRYVFRCQPNVERDDLMSYLRDHNIPSLPYFKPIHLQPFYMEQFGWRPGDLPHTEQAGNSFLALPFSSVMTEAEVEYVCQHLRRGVAEVGR